MHRSLTLICIVFLLLLAPFQHQPVAAGPFHATLASGELFASPAASFTTPGKVNVLIPLSDGRVLAGGSFTSIGGQPAPRSLAIINSAGLLDGTFQVDPRLQVFEVYDAALQADGKIIIAGWFKILPSPYTYSLLRLNPNGSLDNSLTSTSINGQIFSVLVDGDKLLIGGNFTQPAPRIARLNLNGSLDPIFSGVGSGPSDTVRDIARQSTGKYVIVGDFDSYNGLSQVGVARLNTSGSLDTAFATGGFRPSRRVAVLNDNSVVVGGQNICGNQLFAWYTAEGVLKPALDPNPDSFESITALLPLPDGGFLIGGWYSYLCFNNSPVEHEGQVWRYAADGSYRTLASFGNEADVLALALRSDGKVMLGGQGRPKTAADVAVFDGLALLDLSNAGLEKVSAFNPVVGDEADIYSLSRYADGRLLVAGNFSHVNGSPRFGLARLLANGNLDPSFQPFADQPGGWSMAALALPDGRAVAGFGDSGLFLIGGNGALTDLSAFNDYDRVSALAYQAGKVLVGSDFGLGVRRLKADFTGQDETFVPGNAYGAVRALAVQADNKILVAGNFTQYNSAAAPGLVRLNSNGGLDGGFVPPIFMLSEYVTAEIYVLAPLPAGEVLVGGNFTTVDGADHPALVRLDSSGALDNAFSPPSSFHIVYAICVQDDESIWAGGMDASFFRHPLVLHLAEDGQVDTAFTDVFLSAHDEGFVSAILCNSDGLSWAGGRFSFIDGRPFYSLARYFLLRAELFIPFINR